MPTPTRRKSKWGTSEHNTAHSSRSPTQFIGLCKNGMDACVSCMNLSGTDVNAARRYRSGQNPSEGLEKFRGSWSPVDGVGVHLKQERRQASLEARDDSREERGEQAIKVVESKNVTVESVAPSDGGEMGNDPAPWRRDFQGYLSSRDTLQRGQTIVEWWGVRSIHFISF